MKAAVYREYGPPDVVKIENVPAPIAGEGQVLVEVHAASINFGNPSLVRGKPFLIRMMAGGILKPKYLIQGSDFAGQVVSVGPGVTGFKPGDGVYGDLSASGFGTFAEYVVAPADMLARKPANITFAEAAAVPQAALVALQGLKKGRLAAGHKVLVYGASGGNGTFTVQIAKAMGAHVTGVCSYRNTELVTSLGADRVIDYTKEDFVDEGPMYDLILAAAGFRDIRDYKKALKPGGTYVMLGGSMKQVYQSMFGPLFAIGSGKTLTNLSQKQSKEDLQFMKMMIESGTVKPVIDRIYPLDDIVDGLKYYETGRSRGKVVISIKGDQIKFT